MSSAASDKTMSKLPPSKLPPSKLPPDHLEQFGRQSSTKSWARNGSKSRDGTKEREGSELGPEQKERRRQLQAAMMAQSSADMEQLRSALEAAKKAGLDDKDDIQPAVRLLHQLETRQQLVTFCHVLREETEALLAAKTRDEVKALLMESMNISLDDGFQAEVLADFHYHNLAFCRQMQFGVEQTSTLLGIMATVHGKAVVAERLSESVAVQLFEDLVDRHCDQRPPFSVGVFSHAEAAAVKAYAHRTFFRHYSMYMFCYVRNHELVCEVSELSVPPTGVPEPQPLADCHEVDPQEVAELRELLQATEVPVGAPPAEEQGTPGRASLAGAREVTAASQEANEIAAAVDAAFAEKFGKLDFESRLAVPGPA